MLYDMCDCMYRSVEAGSLLIDSSTIDQATVKVMAERATEKGASYIDAPVSGGTTINYCDIVIPRVDHLVLIIPTMSGQYPPRSFSFH